MFWSPCFKTKNINLFSRDRGCGKCSVLHRCCRRFKPHISRYRHTGQAVEFACGFCCESTTSYFFRSIESADNHVVNRTSSKWPSISELRSPTEQASNRYDSDRKRRPSNGPTDLTCIAKRAINTIMRFGPMLLRQCNGCRFYRLMPGKRRRRNIRGLGWDEGTKPTGTNETSEDSLG